MLDTPIQVAPIIESWTEVRCPACVPCGYPSSRLLLKVRGKLPKLECFEQLKCPRCKSLIEWQIGAPLMSILEKGVINHRRQRAAFE